MFVVAVAAFLPGRAYAATEIETQFDNKTCGPGAPASFGTVTALGSLLHSAWAMSVSEGYRVTITTSGAIKGTIKVDGADVVSLPGTPSGSVVGQDIRAFTSTDLEAMYPDDPLSITITCEKVAKSKTNPDPDPDDVGSTVGGMTGQIMTGNTPTPPASGQSCALSDAQRDKLIEDLQKQGGKLQNQIAELGKAFDAARAESIRLWRAHDDAVATARKTITDPDKLGAALRDIKADADAASRTRSDLGSRLWKATIRLSRIKARIDELSAGGCPQMPGDEGDVFVPLNYAPGARAGQQSVPWPMAYAGNGTPPNVPLLAGGDHFVRIGDLPVNIWTRFKADFLDGSAGRSGLKGAATVGIVVGVTPKLDLGIYGLVVGGQVDASASSATVTTGGGGLGVHAAYVLTGLGKITLSASQLWGSSSSSVSGATGRYGSTVTSVSGGISRAIPVGAFTVTPSGSLAWQLFHNDAFTDSSGLSVPASRNEQLVASAGLGISRTIVVGGPVIQTLTPSLGVGAGFVAAQSTSPVPASGLDLLSASTATASVSGGVGAVMAGGATVNLGLSASGLGGKARTYGVSVGFRTALH